MRPGGLPIQIWMNAIAHASALSTTGPQLDNRRVLAALIDLVVVGAGAALILFAADALPSGSGSAREEVGTGLYLVTLAWALYYYFACESGGGQTLGKRAMKLRVVRADGGEAGMREIAVRTVLRVIDGIGLYLVGLIVMLASGKRRQRLGDMAGGTIVVDAGASPEPAAPVPAQSAASPIVPAALNVPTVTLPAVEEPVVHEEPEAADEPVVDEEPEVVEAPPAVVEAPAAVAEPAPADPLTPFEPIMHEDAQPDVPAELDAPVEPPSDDPMVVRSVETVSAIDLVMGDEDEQEEDPAAPPAGR
jgi:uncharacterized RDD family membrane protein YckC